MSTNFIDSINKFNLDIYKFRHCCYCDLCNPWVDWVKRRLVSSPRITCHMNVPLRISVRPYL